MLKLAIKAAKKSGKYLLKHFMDKKILLHKNKFDVTTKIDEESEKIIIFMIKKKFPGHDIYSEEFGKLGKKSDFLWVIDPLDGTINYTKEDTDYCISIGIFKKGVPYIGVVYMPVKNILYTAKKGEGAYINGKKINVSKEKKLINSLAATELSSKSPYRSNTLELMKKFLDSVRNIRITGTSASSCCLVAKGCFEFFLKNKFNPWDFAAGVVIVSEAGGKVTDFKGKKITINSKDIILSNGILHKDIMKIL